MADIQRNDRAIIQGDPRLKQMHLGVQINERINSIKQLDVLLDKIMTVDIKQLELKREELKKEIETLQTEYNRHAIIEVEAKNIETTENK